MRVRPVKTIARLVMVGVILTSILVGCGATGDGTTALDARLADASMPGEAQDGEGTRSVTVYDASADAGGGASRTGTSALAAAFASGTVRSVRVIGDSITAGYGCDGYGNNTDTVIYEGDEGTFLESASTFGCWANDFRAFAAAAGVEGGAFVNAGISGARMSWLADDPAAWLADADVIVVMLGTNDAAWSTIDEYEACARMALAAAGARCTHLVVISPPNNWRDDGRARFTMADADAVLARICSDAGYIYVSALDAVAPDDGTMNADGIHPTTAGSHAIWNSVATQLALA